jgi:hypothetical protein
LYRALSDGIPDFLRRRQRKGWVAIIQDHQKFLAPVASHKIVGTHGGQQAFGGFAQDLVPNEMTKGIVHILEMINVTEDDDGRGGLAMRT